MIGQRPVGFEVKSRWARKGTEEGSEGDGWGAVISRLHLDLRSRAGGQAGDRLFHRREFLEAWMGIRNEAQTKAWLTWKTWVRG